MMRRFAGCVGCLFGVVVLAGCPTMPYMVDGKVVTLPGLNESFIAEFTGRELPDPATPVEGAEVFWVALPPEDDGISTKDLTSNEALAEYRHMNDLAIWGRWDEWEEYYDLRRFPVFSWLERSDSGGNFGLADSMETNCLLVVVKKGFQSVSMTVTEKPRMDRKFLVFLKQVEEE